MNQPETTTLYFTSGSSDKEYRVELVEDGAGWTVVAYNGRRGKANTRRPQMDVPASFQAAKAVFDAVVAKKTKEGYVRDASGTSELADEVQRKKRVALLSKHVNSDEGFFAAFRVPDDVHYIPLGSVERVAECASEWGADIVFNNFWMVSKADTPTLVQWCTDQLTALKNNCEEDPEDVAGAMIGVWGDPQLPYQLVGTFSDIPDQMGDENFPPIDAWQIAFDGNDNGIEEMWRGVMDQGDEMTADERMVALKLSTNILAQHDYYYGYMALTDEQKSNPLLAFLAYATEVVKDQGRALEFMQELAARLSKTNLEENLDGAIVTAPAKSLKI